jgi:two-component system NarL family sensor kinase
MSVAAAGNPKQERSTRRPARELVGVRAFFTAISIVAIAGLGMSLGSTWSGVMDRWPVWLLWAGVVAVADLLPVRLWGSVSLSMSLPIALAAAMVLTAPEAGVIAFIGSTDPRELRRQVSVSRGIFNRSQVAISTAAASWVFHLGGVSIVDWPEVLPAAIAALAADFAVNTILVCAAMTMQTKTPPLEVLREMFAPHPMEFGAIYLCIGLQGPLVAVSYEVGGTLALLAFLGPLALARHTLVQAQSLQEAARQVESKNRALAQVSARVVDERRDERMTVAGELHDEVLPPLFKVHLMGQVLRHDLANGQLLNLDEDLPDLLHATKAAQDSLREIIRDLRRSTLGTRGLPDTVKLLAHQVEAAGGPSVTVECEVSLGGSDLAQLLAYQVVRESLNNAAKHAKAEVIRVHLWRDDDDIRVTVEDDGLGFDRNTVDREAHFGLQLMEERVEAVGGRLYVDSQLGNGTRVVAAIPASTDR